MEWCSHIRPDDSGQFRCTYDNNRISVAVYEDLIVCPICGAPRPKNPKELWELLRYADAEFHETNSPVFNEYRGDPYNYLEYVAKRWFIERIEQADAVFYTHEREKIKRAINYEDTHDNG